MDYEHISVVLSKRASVQHAAPFGEPRASGLPWLYGIFLLGILAAVAYWVVLYRKPKEIEHAPPN
jgi:type III secretion protein J